MQLYDEINLFLYNISLLLNGKMLLSKKKKKKFLITIFMFDLLK